MICYGRMIYILHQMLQLVHALSPKTIEVQYGLTVNEEMHGSVSFGSTGMNMRIITANDSAACSSLGED